MVNPFDELIVVDFKMLVPISIRLSSLRYPCVYTREFAFRKDMVALLSSQVLMKKLLEGFDSIFKDLLNIDNEEYKTHTTITHGKDNLN